MTLRQTQIIAEVRSIHRKLILNGYLLMFFEGVSDNWLTQTHNERYAEPAGYCIAITSICHDE